MKQRDAFLDGHGDMWLERNRKDIGKKDVVTELLTRQVEKIDGSVLEIGCSNGWRLRNIKKHYGCAVQGIDPSSEAFKEGDAEVPIAVGTADNLPFPDQKFTVVILGYCLFVTDPADWFMIAHEATRVLMDGGLLVIYDHNVSRLVKLTWPYPDYAGENLFMRWQDWPKFFMAHPGIKLRAEHILLPTHDAVAFLEKDFRI